MSINWLSVFIAWAVGIVSGLVANWLYQKLIDWKKRRSKADYITSTWTENTIRFEGQISSGTVDMGEVAKRVMGIQKTQDKDETKSS